MVDYNLTGPNLLLQPESTLNYGLGPAGYIHGFINQSYILVSMCFFVSITCEHFVFFRIVKDPINVHRKN